MKIDRKDTNYLPQFARLILLWSIWMLHITSVGAQQDTTAKQKKKPLAYFEKLVEDQQKGLDLHNEGYRYYMKGQYQQALQLFNEALQHDSVNAHYFSNRGHTHKQLGHWEAALADYRRANKIEPTSTHETYFQSAEILHKKLNKYQEALPLYTKSMAIIQQTGMVLDLHKCYFSRANCQLKLKHYQEAIKDFTKTIELRPEHYQSFTNRGMARYNIKDVKGACRDWEKAVELGYNLAQGYVTSYCK